METGTSIMGRDLYHPMALLTFISHYQPHVLHPQLGMLMDVVMLKNMFITSVPKTMRCCTIPCHDSIVVTI